MISVQNLVVRFGQATVLNKITLEVPKGEILVVMGSSGGGKTTLLRCMAGLMRPSEGDVLIDGLSMAKEPERAAKAVGMVFQYSALFDSLDVKANVLFGVQRQRRISKSEGQTLTTELLKEVGLSGTESKLPSELSGGMRKRVGLARALAMRPQVLLYDEPTSGLDPVTAYSIDRLIVDTRDHLGLTSVVVSHDLSSVMRVADRVAFLDRGHMVFLGSVPEFHEASHGAIRELIDRARAESFDATLAES